MYESMTHTICTASLPLGTTNSNTPVTATSGADKSSHGRALPCAVRVRSITAPIITLVMASIILDTMGNTTKNMPPQTVPKPKTSV